MSHGISAKTGSEYRNIADILVERGNKKRNGEMASEMRRAGTVRTRREPFHKGSLIMDGTLSQ
jgi:hypothetical protein